MLSVWWRPRRQGDILPRIKKSGTTYKKSRPHRNLAIVVAAHIYISDENHRARECGKIHFECGKIDRELYVKTTATNRPITSA